MAACLRSHDLRSIFVRLLDFVMASASVGAGQTSRTVRCIGGVDIEKNTQNKTLQTFNHRPVPHSTCRTLKDVSTTPDNSGTNCAEQCRLIAGCKMLVNVFHLFHISFQKLDIKFSSIVSKMFSIVYSIESNESSFGG